MLVSCTTRSFRPHPLTAALTCIRGAGLRHVELSAADVAGEGPELAAVLANHELCVASLNLVSEVRDDKDEAADRRAFEIARRLGARVVIVAAGVAEDEARLDILCQRHRRLGGWAAELGLTVALETQPGLCGDTLNMLRTLQTIDHSAVRLNFDTAAYLLNNPERSGEVALARVCTQLASLRLSDATGLPGAFGLPQLGQGTAVDFARTLEILKPLAFNGPCAISFFLGRRRGSPTLEACRRALEGSVAHLRRCGWFDGS